MDNKKIMAVAGAVAIGLSAISAWAIDDKAACEQAYKEKAAGAYKLCLPLAQDDEAQYERYIGDMFFFGWEVDNIAQSYDKALLWYRRAAMQGDVEAKYDMGVMLENGWGTDKNAGNAVKWYRSAGQDGHIAAQLNLGNMYSKGDGIEVNDKRACTWYLRAAKQGDAVAQYNIGTRYAKGAGVEVNYVESYKWLLLAQTAGVEEAAASLKTLESKIPGSDRNEAQRLARSWKPEMEKP